MDYNIRKPGVLSRPDHQSSTAAIIFVALVLVLLVAGGVFARLRHDRGGAVGPGEAHGISGGSQILAVGATAH